MLKIYFIMRIIKRGGNTLEYRYKSKKVDTAQIPIDKIDSVLPNINLRYKLVIH